MVLKVEYEYIGKEQATQLNFQGGQAIQAYDITSKGKNGDDEE